MTAAFDWIDQEAEARRAGGLLRRLRPRGPSADALPTVDFASNDYLGLARDPRVVDAAAEAARQYGFGAAASPLISGWTDEHQRLSTDLAAFEAVEAVALFPSGFAANLGVIAALVGPGDAVYADRLNHACLVAGARMAGACLRIYPHGDAARLDEIVRRDRAAGRFRRSLIATDAVFSMDGDLAPLPQLVEISQRHGAMLLIDEAHATGVFGPDGRGAAAALGVDASFGVKVGTLSKALGSIGGFVAGSSRLIEQVIHRAPTFMFSTALPPAACAAARVALELSRAEPWRRERAHRLGDQLRQRLRCRGWSVPDSVGPIVPLILGDPAAATELSERLRAAGYHAPAIRPPTVPRATSRLRISVSAARTEEEVQGLLTAIGGRSADPSSALIG